MAGRPRIIKCKQSYINYTDNNTASGNMKMGTSPSVGVIRYYWHNYQSHCNQTAGKPKKSYNNMVFLNINPAITPVSAGFPQSQQAGLYINYPGRTQPLSTYQAKMFRHGPMARFFYINGQIPGFSQQQPQYYSPQTEIGITRRLY